LKNIKIKFNDANLRKTIGNNDLNINCPKCNYTLNVKIKDSLAVCPNCNESIIIDSKSLINDVAKSFKDAFK
jgi:predicted RNA-binding Zn-ribbon protein involved in translation (DUF1610 family)